MNKDEKIKDLAKAIGVAFQTAQTTRFSEIAEALVDMGYHRTIWHKVADGDLPEEYHEVRFVSGTGYHHNGVYVKATNAFYKDGDIKYNIDEVIAWAELPKYKE